MGRPKRYDGKVDFGDLSRFVYEGEVSKDLHVHTQTLWHASLKRSLRVVLLLNTSKDKPRYILLFSTDLFLSGCELVELYKLRFQIEFLFRDAKQLTGLTDCQARDGKALSFHFNTSLSAVNLAKLDLLAQHDPEADFVFSLRSYIHRSFSHLAAFSTFSKLRPRPQLPKSQCCFYPRPCFRKRRSLKVSEVLWVIRNRNLPRIDADNDCILIGDEGRTP